MLKLGMLARNADTNTNIAAPMINRMLNKARADLPFAFVYQKTDVQPQ